MFNIGPFHRSTGQPAGFFDSLFPIEPLPADAALPPRVVAPVPGLGRHAVAMVLLLGLTLGVHSAVGWWTLSGHPAALAPSAQAPSVQAPS